MLVCKTWELLHARPFGVEVHDACCTKKSYLWDASTYLIWIRPFTCWPLLREIQQSSSLSHPSTDGNAWNWPEHVLYACSGDLCITPPLLVVNVWTLYLNTAWGSRMKPGLHCYVIVAAYNQSHRSFHYRAALSPWILAYQTKQTDMVIVTTYFFDVIWVGLLFSGYWFGLTGFQG